MARHASIVLLSALVAWPVASRQQLYLRNLTANIEYNFGSGLSINDEGQVGTITQINGADQFVILDDSGLLDVTRSAVADVGQGSLNDAGHAVFRSGGDAWLFDGVTIRNLTQGSVVVEPAGLLGKTINNEGQVAVSTSSGVWLFDGLSSTNLTAGTSIDILGNQPPSLNRGGDVAFRGASSATNAVAMYLSDRRGLTSLSADPALGITDVNGFPAINDHGQVAFIAVADRSRNDLFFYDGRRSVNLSKELGLAFGISAIALNNKGDISFTTLGHDVMLLTGKRLMTVASGVECSSCLSINDRGDVAFTKGGDIFIASQRPPKK